MTTIPITIDEITKNVNVINNVVTGDGIFDNLMETVNLHIKAQFDSGRLKGVDYATVYLGAMQSVISQSIQFGLQANEKSAQADLIEAQKLLYDRQREGFDDNKNQKLFEAQLNAWSLMYSSGLLTTKPSIISNDEVSTIYNTLKPTT